MNAGEARTASDSTPGRCRSVVVRRRRDRLLDGPERGAGTAALAAGCGDDDLEAELDGESCEGVQPGAVDAVVVGHQHLGHGRATSIPSSEPTSATLETWNPPR
jgi:hypothetical protein